jgi:hypothetical protein
MAKKSNRTLPGEQFVKLLRPLLESDSWRSMGIKERRVIDFLMLEHLRHGGKDNGQLKATHRQLLDLGFNRKSVGTVLANLEERGLIGCIKGGMRVATLFRLTWLPTFGWDVNGKLGELLPGHEWQSFRDPAWEQSKRKKSKNLQNKDTAGLPNKDTAVEAKLPNKETADGPKNLPNNHTALSRASLPRTGDRDSIYQDEAPTARVVPLRVAQN